MKNIIYYLIPSFIWGSTWLVITFQLGVVDPIVSVAYRFLLAAIILMIYCRIKGMNMKYSPIQHLFMAIQGFLLFGINYWLVYLAEMNLKSGLVALIFSLIILMNIINGFIFLHSPVRKKVLAGGAIGILGTLLVFENDLANFSFTNENSFALIISLVSVMFASLGNITSARNQKNKLPVIQTNAFGMLYGSLSMFIVAFITGAEINFDPSFIYISSLIYLAVFGSIIAFSTYLVLLGNIGADKAAYVTLVVPVIALLLSTIFENYTWNLYAVTGVTLILLGNGLIITKNPKLQKG